MKMNDTSGGEDLRETMTIATKMVKEVCGFKMNLTGHTEVF